MQGLSYLTRGGDLPTNKPNILLVAHPDDLSLAISALADDVLTALDAALWYSDSGYADISDADLSDINLVIVSVTEGLLSDFSDTARILDMARSRMLPVLPILTEEISLPNFEDRFGTVQLLDRRGTLTSDYSRRLRERLDELDLDNTLRTSIAGHFDATLFLSYRHIDRSLANRLMGVIHDTPVLRDVAIWYDDQLTVGIDYNEEILNSVRSADVFVLAVTPSLLEDGNYVMTREYPSAVGASVPVLPVMMQETDLAALRAKYPGIPDPIYPEEISAALPALLGDRLNRDNDNDPFHLYYVGIAYHLGVSVEIDNARAVALLTRSAELGCVDANRRLGAMYYFGNGVEESKETAITLYRKYVAGCKTLFNTDESSNTLLEALINAYWLLYLVIDENELAERRRLAEIATNHTLTLVERTGRDDAYRLLVRSLARYATVLRDQLDYSGAISIYTVAIRHARDLYKATSAIEDLEGYVDCLRATARLYLHEDRAKDAVDLILAALHLLEDEGEHRHADDRRLRILAADVYDTLGSVCDSLEDYDGSICACRKAISLYRGLLAYESGTYYLSEIYFLECSILESYLLLDKPDDAEAELAVVSELCANPAVARNATYKINHAIQILLYRARIAIARKEHKAAEGILAEAEEMAKGAGADLWEWVYNRIHSAYKSLYYAMKKPHLADYHHAIMLKTATDNAINRARPRDFERLSDIYSDISARTREDKEMWKEYSSLAMEGKLNFYPDESHLERERDIHLYNLRGNSLVILTGILLVVGFMLVECFIWQIYSSTQQRWFVNSVMLFYLVGQLGDVGSYLFLRSRRHLPYSALAVFKRTERLTGFLARYHLYSIPPLAITAILIFTIGDNIPNVAINVIVILFLFFLAFNRILAAFDKSIARERSRAFWRISRLMPLEKKKKGRAK